MQLLAVVIFAVCAGISCGASTKHLDQKPTSEDESAPPCNPCCPCGDSISFTLKLRNQFKAPFFESEVQVVDQPQRELFYMLQRAADKNPAFKFSASYHGPMGFVITSINQVAGSMEDKTYWKVIEHPNGNSLSQGVSSYIPADGEVIMFNLTTWAMD